MFRCESGNCCNRITCRIVRVSNRVGRRVGSCEGEQRRALPRCPTQQRALRRPSEEAEAAAGATGSEPPSQSQTYVRAERETCTPACLTTRTSNLTSDKENSGRRARVYIQIFSSYVTT